jgi:hypothetical protein
MAIDVEGWTNIVADIEAGRPGPWDCPEQQDGQIEVRGITNGDGALVEWHLKCHSCGAETYVRRGPKQRA